VKLVEVNMSITANGKEMLASSGSETMACLTLGLCGNPGDPAFSSRRGVCPTTEEGERQKRRRESDGFVVPMKAGNAAGGKEATHGSAV
jgi:hypothetical protein